MKLLKYTLVFSTLIGCVFAFQNCGSPQSSSGSLTAASEEQATYILPSEVTPLIESYKLDWSLTKSSEFLKAASNLRGQCESRRNDFESTRKVVPIILDTGLLPNDPLIAEMENARISFDKALNVAFCAYFAKTSDERHLALTSMVNYIVDWNNTYVGDGNPVNERFFVKLFTLADLIFPLLNQEQIVAIRSLAQRMDQKEVTFISSLNAGDSRLKNNWRIRHLIIRIHANIILNNPVQIQALKTALDQQITTQFTAPAGFTLSSCSHLRNVGAYGSFDLQERGALSSHVAGITEMIPLLVLSEGFMSASAKAKLFEALELLKPYVLGEKVNTEFVCSTIPYDAERIAIDPTIAANWNPNGSRVLFRYARLIWESTESWTGRFITNEYAPWFKVFYAGKGDVLTLPSTP